MVKRSKQLDTIFGALSDPTRRKIIDRLMYQGETTLSDIAYPFDMSLPAVSKHIKVLEDAGIVKRRRVGRSQLCSVNPKKLQQGVTWLLQYQHFWNTSFDRLEKHLKNKK